MKTFGKTNEESKTDDIIGVADTKDAADSQHSVVNAWKVFAYIESLLLLVGSTYWTYQNSDRFFDAPTEASKEEEEAQAAKGCQLFKSPVVESGGSDDSEGFRPSSLSENRVVMGSTVTAVASAGIVFFRKVWRRFRGGQANAPGRDRIGDQSSQETLGIGVNSFKLSPDHDTSPTKSRPKEKCSWCDFVKGELGGRSISESE